MIVHNNELVYRSEITFGQEPGLKSHPLLLHQRHSHIKEKSWGQGNNRIFALIKTINIPAPSLKI